MAGLRFRHGKELRQPGDAESGVTAPLHLKEPVEMVQPSSRRPKTFWRDNIFHLAWERPRIKKKKFFF